MAQPAHTPTIEQQDLIDGIVALLKDEPRVEAAYLSGSLGKGQGDVFSDIDVLVVASDGTFAAVSADLAPRLPSVATPVLVNNLYGGRLLNVVTDTWQRFDLSFTEPKELGFQDSSVLKELFNRSDVRPPLRPPGPYRPTPDTLRKLVEEFIRVCGLTPVAVGRGEILLMLAGTQLLRQMTMDLMLEENSISPAARGGALRRNPFLTEEQRIELESAPPLVATRDSALEAQMYLAGVFLPRARRLAADIGMEWPTAFEEATRRHLQKTIGLRWPQADLS